VDHLTEARVEWAVASRPLEPEAPGDAYIARPLPGGILLGVVDGLGHGPAACAASREAIRFLESARVEHPLAVVRLCHERLRATRGVVLTLAWIDETRDCMTWLGVGNVQAVLLRAHGAEPGCEILVGRGGIVGRVLRSLHASPVSISPGDLLVLATDGIHPRFTQGVPRRQSLQAVADLILTEHCTGVDDALVLAARYRGAPE
jgi:phosphoserine phosphatase RsbX